MRARGGSADGNGAVDGEDSKAKRTGLMKYVAEVEVRFQAMCFIFEC